MTFNEARLALAATGLVDPHQSVPAFTDEPKIPAFLCYPSAKAANLYKVTQGVNGSGFHPDPERAGLQAVAECLERLSLMNPPEAQLVRGRPADVSGAIDPLAFRAHSAAQFPNFAEFERQVADCNFRWWPVTALGTDENVLLPAQFVFLSSIVNDEVLIRREQITTGAALGPIGTDIAFASGLFEAVERDATMAAYLTRTSPPRIVQLSTDLQDAVDYFRRYHLEPHFLDVTTDLGIPCVVAVTVDETGLGPAINIGTAAGLNYEDTILSALYESIQTRNPGRLFRDPSAESTPSSEGPSTIEQRFDEWYPVERIPDLGFWLETPHRVGYDELVSRSRTLDQAKNALLDRGFHIYVADVTLPELKQAGFEVLRVVVPELHPLYLTEANKMLYSVHHGEIPNDPSLPPHPVL